mgnify:CR=1 FL=1
MGGGTVGSHPSTMPHEFPPPSAFRGMHFPGQHDGERVLLVLRRHPFVFVLVTVAFVLFALLPLFIRFLIPESFFQNLEGTIWEALISVALSMYFLFLWLFFAYAWVDYYLDLWIVTDERIVNIEQAVFFNRVISEQRLLRVQDATSEVKWLFPTFLDYGNVFIQTAGERERFVFEQVPHPDLVKKVVLLAHEEALRQAGVHESVPPIV